MDIPFDMHFWRDLDGHLASQRCGQTQHDFHPQTECKGSPNGLHMRSLVPYPLQLTGACYHMDPLGCVHENMGLERASVRRTWPKIGVCLRRLLSLLVHLGSEK